MPAVDETNLTDLAAPLFAGVEQISRDQAVTFTLYRKRVFPADQFVYWVNAALVDDPPVETTISVKGSLHRTANETQAEDGTYAVNRVVFTSEQQVDSFNDIAPLDMWLGAFDEVRFTFNSILTQRYVQAGLFHYVGDAVYPALETQIIDTPEQLAALETVVSNSLPLWLTLTMGDTIAVYPSYLVPDNIRPPYIAVHIFPENTAAIQSAPRVDETSSRWQLAQDKVRVTMYGLNNKQALAWIDYVAAYSLDSDALGLMNMPVPRDEKRIQTELSVIAQKKTVEFDVNYYQAAVYAIARVYILSCMASFNPQGGILPPDMIITQDGDILVTQDDHPLGAST